MKKMRSDNALDSRDNINISASQNLWQKIKDREDRSLQTIIAFVNMLDAKDLNTAGHSSRVAKYAVEIGRRMGIKEDELVNLYYAAFFHDVGRIGIPDVIFSKPSSLTSEEYEIVKKHTAIGEDLIKNLVDIPELKQGVRHHHEHFDGNGYPDGLKGENIPLAARIICVADSYDAMSSNRPYRKDLTITEIRKEIFNSRDTHFDPLIADIMLEIIDDGIIINNDNHHQGEDMSNQNHNSALLQNVMKTYAQSAYENVYKDKLTNVWNREYIKKYVDHFFMNAMNRGYLFMLDLDNFKSVNDIYGHSAGDEMIILFADTMQNVVGSDGIVARIGGDEFVIFFPNEDNGEYIQTIANSIIENMKSNVEGCRKGCGVSASIGIAQSDRKMNTFDKLFDKADKALYFVKEHGKGYSHCFSQKETVVKPVEVERQAVANITYLKKILDEGNKIEGAYRVGYDSFTRIYRFILRRNERMNQKALIILYTVKDSSGNIPENSILAGAMQILETSVLRSLRKGDVTSRYSDNQQIVLIMDAENMDSGRTAAKRINEVFRQNGGKAFELSFELSEI